jgi:ribokinase
MRAPAGRHMCRPGAGHTWPALHDVDMTRVAVVGHVEWVDFISVDRMPGPGQIAHARGAFARAAGGGGVVAVVLAELGAEVDFFTALGDDPHGHSAAEQLSARGVGVHVAWRSEPTRRALTLLEDDGERTIVTVGERLEPHGADALEWDRLHEADGVYFTAGDPAAAARARWARSLVASPRGRAALRDVAIDALVFSARDRDESEWARKLSARLMVETLGTEGGVWRGESSGRWSAAEPPGEVRDAYGCGDSFAAGFTYGLATGLSVQEAAAVGAQAGARCLTRPGAP